MDKSRHSPLELLVSVFESRQAPVPCSKQPIGPRPSSGTHSSQRPWMKMQLLPWIPSGTAGYADDTGKRSNKSTGVFSRLHPRGGMPRRTPRLRYASHPHCGIYLSKDTIVGRSEGRTRCGAPRVRFRDVVTIPLPDHGRAV